MSSMREAADRLEELERDLVRLRRVTTRPEPSRLEIAAMLAQGLLSGPECVTGPEEASIVGIAVCMADALIAEAKEAK